MWSCFEDLVMTKIMMKPKFNIDDRFNIYSFFILESDVHVGDVSIISFSVCMYPLISWQYAHHNSQII